MRRSSNWNWLRGLAVCGGVLLAAPHSHGQVEVTLYADSVPDQAEWREESRAVGAPDSNGNDDQYAQTANNTTTQFLLADSFQPFVLPEQRVITRVWVDVLCRYNANTSGNQVRLRASGSVPQTTYDSAAWNQAAGDTQLRWRMGGSRGVDITGLRASWRQDDIRRIDLEVRRLVGNTELRVDAFRIVIRHELDTDGDGIPNSVDADDDGDGVEDASDCAPLDPTRWRNVAYVDVDGDGIGSGSPVVLPCFGAVIPSGYATTGGDNCPSHFNPNQSDADSDGIGDACDFCTVGLISLLEFIASWNSQLGQSASGASADYNGDGSVDLLDLLNFLQDWQILLGSTYPC